MNLKKMFLLVTSGLVFFIVFMSVINVLSYSMKSSKEKVVLSLTHEITLDSTLTSYNFVEVKKEENVEKEKEEKKELTVTEEKEEEADSIKEEKNNENSNESAVYVGRMTGYGPDCAGCSGSGNLSCTSSHNLVRDGEFYNDSTYGSVRIVAAATDGFPCGTIVKVSNSNLGEFYAIVLDTGGSVRRAWANGIVWMDLAFKTESDPAIYSATGNDITYTVQRLGW